MSVDQSMSPSSTGDARGRRADLAALRSEWQAVHGELSTVVEAILAEIFATASRQAVEVLARLEREGADLLADLEARRLAAQSEMTELAGRLEHLERRVSMAETERRQALDAAERATAELLVRARRQADEIVDDAEARAAQILEEARRRAEELEREAERGAPAPAAVAEAAVVENQLRGLAERISRLLQTTSEVTSTDVTVGPARGAEAAPATDVGTAPSPSTDYSPTVSRLALEPPATGMTPEPARSDEGDDEQPWERDVVVPLRPRAVESPAVWAAGRPNEFPSERALAGREAIVEGEPDPWLAPAASIDQELERGSGALPHADAGDEWEAPATDVGPECDRLPLGPNGVAESTRPIELAAAFGGGPDLAEDTDAAQSPFQTLVFQAVPSFQSALALERALKGLAGVHDVRVADFDERQLTFQVTHDLGAGLTRGVLALRSHDLELVDSGRDRAEFMLRA